MHLHSANLEGIRGIVEIVASIGPVDWHHLVVGRGCAVGNIFGIVLGPIISSSGKNVTKVEGDEVLAHIEEYPNYCICSRPKDCNSEDLR